MMSKSPKLIETDEANFWLRQFKVEDQKLASDLLDRFLLVSRDEFGKQLRALVLDRYKDAKGPVGLYAEREVRKRNKIPNRLFKESKTKIKRAFGLGPKVIEPIQGYDRSVGSEGIVAQLITQLCAQFPDRFISHPGPEKIRELKIRHLSILTDFIGSGTRARFYLEAAWRVSSVKSWRSYKLIEFSVIAYSSTQMGKTYVERHPSHPEIVYLVSCPTIKSEFSPAEFPQYRQLCEKYNPSNVNRKDPTGSPTGMGFNNGGALIAFAHGAPNNTPEMFHKTNRKKTWVPLFPSRVTADIPTETFGRKLSEKAIKYRLKNLGQESLIENDYVSNVDEKKLKVFLILTSLLLAPRTDEVIANKTGYNLLEIKKECEQLTAQGWINIRRRLTESGYKELLALREDLRKKKKRHRNGVDLNVDPYYPSQLRFPV